MSNQAAKQCYTMTNMHERMNKLPHRSLVILRSGDFIIFIIERDANGRFVRLLEMRRFKPPKHLIIGTNASP